MRKQTRIIPSCFSQSRQPGVTPNAPGPVFEEILFLEAQQGRFVKASLPYLFVLKIVPKQSSCIRTPFSAYGYSSVDSLESGVMR